ncbi:MAG: hypothetical protein H7837_03105 [Magnetococcus sp. MYC-9]
MNHIPERHGIRLAGVLSLCWIISGCGSLSPSGVDMDMLSGGLLDSLIGSAKNGGAGTPAAGGVVGHETDNSMDKTDRLHLGQAFERAPDNQPVTWVNADSGNRYTVTLRSTGHNAAGQPCRQAEIESIIQEQPSAVIQMACRRPDGLWAF